VSNIYLLIAMPQYRINYFDVRGLAEVARLILAQAGQEFVDHRFSREQWPEEKTNSKRYPFGVAPTLEFDDVVLPESIPLSRYLASELGLNGKNNLEKAWCDIVVDILVEIRKELWPFTTFGRKEKDDAKFEEQKKAAFEGVIAKKLGHIEGILKANNGGSGFFVGDGVTWADLVFLDASGRMLEVCSTCLDQTPLLKALVDRVKELPRIKKHIETRPERPV